MKKGDKLTGFAYLFVHFTVEVLCFYTVYHIFSGTELWWLVGILFDTLAFAPQAAIGRFCEKHPHFLPGPAGGAMLMAGAAMILLGPSVTAVWVTGFILLTIGNCCVHISGAMATLRVSEGNLSESALFVGGGSFGVITGRLLSRSAGIFWLPFVLMAAGIAVMFFIDRRVKNKYGSEAYDFDAAPCLHDFAAEKTDYVIILILTLVVCVRAYIGYGLPTAWNQTTVQTIFLFCFMGTGKILGGVFSDLFGARRVGVFSCLAAIPVLLVSNNIMWLSLIGVALFSMTMAITLGGLVSVLRQDPGVAFGITTIGLLLGTVPTFFFPMPERLKCNILIAVMSVLAAAGLRYCLKPQKSILKRRKSL